ncbi:MAG: hypothetical protein U9N81_06555 [Bacillota bacterium]|nr:hypothetical protein [Bacillota bacterium]
MILFDTFRFARKKFFQYRAVAENPATDRFQNVPSDNLLVLFPDIFELPDAQSFPVNVSGHHFFIKARFILPDKTAGHLNNLRSGTEIFFHPVNLRLVVDCWEIQKILWLGCTKVEML